MRFQEEDSKVSDTRNTISIKTFFIGNDKKEKFSSLKEYCEGIYLSQIPDITVSLIKRN